MRRRRAALLNIVFNYTSTGVVVLNTLFLIPLYLRFFSLADYGLWSVCNNVLGWLAIAELGFFPIFARRLMKAVDSKEEFGRSAAAGVTITAFCAGVAAVIGLLSAALGEVWMPLVANAEVTSFTLHRIGLALASVGVALTMLQAGLFAVCQAWQVSTAPGWANVIGLVASIGTSLTCLAMNGRVASIGAGLCSRSLIAVIITGTYLASQSRQRGVRWTIRRSSVSAMADGIFYIGGARTFATVVSNCEAVVSSAVLGPSATGVLALTGRVYDVARMLLAPIGSSVYAGLAHVFEKEGRDRTRAVLVELFAIYGGISFFLFVPAVALNGAFMHVWVKGVGYGGEILSVLIAISVHANARAGFLGLILGSLDKLRENARISTADAVARVMLLAAFPPIIGISGIPVASILASTFSTALMLRPLSEALGVDRKRALVLVARDDLLLAGGLACALLVALFLVPASDNWLVFVALSAGVGVVVGAVALQSNPSAKAYAVRLMRRGRLR